jgi:hypothetical protein
MAHNRLKCGHSHHIMIGVTADLKDAKGLLDELSS